MLPAKATLLRPLAHPLAHALEGKLRVKNADWNLIRTNKFWQRIW
jgi:hypothetical protein